MKSWPNVATKQLQSRKKVQQKSRGIVCKAKFFPPYLRQVAKIYVATSHNVVWLEIIEISKQRTAFIWCFAQEVDWCLQDCDKQRLQTTVSINLWKIFAGHTGDWFDVRTASICTTDLWDAPKSFILNSLKFKVAPYPIIVSLDTLTRLQKSKLWSFLAVRVLALSRPEVSASSYKQRTRRERGERRKKICTVNLEKQQGAWMNGVQNWGYSSLMINSRTLESISCPKPVLPLQMVIRPCFEALQVLWCRCRSHDGGWEGIPCCNRSVRKWSQDGVRWTFSVG